jgi:hypothetical protein
VSCEGMGDGCGSRFESGWGLGTANGAGDGCQGGSC